MTKTQVKVGIAVVVALAVVVLFFIFGNPIMTINNNSQGASPSLANSQGQSQAQGLVVQDEQVGTGAAAQLGDTLTVDYTGKLQNGTVFDTSVGKTPFKFMLGAGQVIPGWDTGLAGMKVGGKRLLIIPPALAYGSRAIGPIPADSTLVFEVTLLGVTPAGQ